MIITERVDNIEIVSFDIEKINAIISEDLKARLSKLFDQQGARVIINLEGVEYIDSSGFGCFLSVLRIARDNYGSIKFTSPGPAVKKLFEALRLDTVFDLCPNKEECLKSFR